MKIFHTILFSIITFFSFAQTKLIVSKDGTGNYTTVQQAFNAIPKNNKKPVTIIVKNGTYYEKLWLDSTKDFVTLIGEDKFKTILTYNDHTGKLSPKGDTINTRTSQTFMIQANNFSAENISFENNAGFNAGQAVAVQACGDRLKFSTCRFLGFQDVLFVPKGNSRQYYEHCYIEGTTDFIFGDATVWFEQCHIHNKKDSHITAASTPKENEFGYVFNDCIITGDSSVRKATLGRPWRPNASVTYINCFIDKHIIPEGWNNWKNPENEKTARYAEYHNYGPGANTAKRFAWTKQLTDEEVKKFTVKNVLGNWNPK